MEPQQVVLIQSRFADWRRSGTGLNPMPVVPMQPEIQFLAVYVCVLIATRAARLDKARSALPLVRGV